MAWAQWKRWYTPFQTILRRFGNRSLYSSARRLGLLWQYYAFKPDEPDLLLFKQFASADGGVFLDVGANAGQTIVAIRRILPKHRIISIEANPTLKGDLDFIRRFVGKRMTEVKYIGLADTTGELTFYVPWVGNTPVETQASLEHARVKEAAKTLSDWTGVPAKIEETNIPVYTLDQLDLAPDAIKIDVESSEARVVRGALQTIKKYRPTILAEANEFSSEVRSLLEPLDYVYKACGKGPALAEETIACRNYFMIPREKLNGLKER